MSGGGSRRLGAPRQKRRPINVGVESALAALKTSSRLVVENRVHEEQGVGVSKRRDALIAGAIVLALPQLPLGAEPVALPIDRATVEQVRAGLGDTVRIVDWHGTWDFTTIQAALDAASDGDTVIVLPSTGSPVGAYVENIVFPARAITLQSIEPQDPDIVAATVIDGNAAGRVVQFGVGTPAGASLLGLTITNGVAPGSTTPGFGGGLWLDDSSPFIAWNIITGNWASGGGGIWCTGYSSSIISDNSITRNGGGGISCDFSSSPLIISNWIADNTTRGGIYTASDSSLIVGNLIVGNSGAGGGVGCGGAASIVGNLIAGNHGTIAGGGVYCGPGATPLIIGDTIVGNSASSGSGVLCSLSSPTIVNTIIAFNSSGIRSDSATPALRHNCVYGNVEYDYLGVADPSGTEGNIAVDPAFLLEPDPGPDATWGTDDDDYGDLHLLARSPCVDAGTNGDVSDGLDLDGHSRIVDGNFDGVAIVDMGAYEYLPADLDDDGAVDLADYALWAGCIEGPEAAPAAGCDLADLDGDGDVDLADFARLGRMMR
jgi:hypothetical protein